MSDRFTPLESAKKQCSELGLRLGTSDYAQCVQNLYAHKQSVNAARAASQDNIIMMQPSIAPVPQVPQYRQTYTSCQYRQIGNHVDCTSY